MAAIMFNDAIPFEQIVNILLTKGPMWNLEKIGQAVSEKTYKDYKTLLMHIAQEKGQMTPNILIVAKQFYYLNHSFSLTVLISIEKMNFQHFPIQM